MAKEPGFTKPNYTQSPNHFYDEILPLIDSLAELKVTDVIIRQTFGFHRDEKELSISLLVTLTGLSKPSVVDGIERAMARGTVERRPFGQGFVYRLRLVKNLNYPESGSKESLLVPVKNLNQSSKGSRPEVVKNLNTWKENEINLKESIKKRPPNLKSIARCSDAELRGHLETVRASEEEHGKTAFEVIDEIDAAYGGFIHSADADILRSRVIA